MRIKVSVYQDTDTWEYARQILQAFAHGVEQVGDKVKLVSGNKYKPADVAVIVWSPKIVEGYDFTRFRRKIFRQQRSLNKRTIIIEQPLIRKPDLGKFYQLRVGFDDVTRRGEFANRNCDNARWRQLGIPLQDWREGGGDVVVVGQLPGDYSLGKLDINKWVEDTTSQLATLTNRRVVFKPHPVALRDNVAMPNVSVPVIEDLDWQDVWATVSYSSGMVIDSLVAGVPALVCSDRSMGWDICSNDLASINEPLQPEREQWLWDIAYSQWTLQEIHSGQPWRRLREYAFL